jgi:quercetin dioxygenase-like cupin family protein
MKRTGVAAAAAAGRGVGTPFTLVRDEQRPLHIVGEQLTILASGAQTGSYELFRQVGPEGSGPPPHAHPWDESFYVIDGKVDFTIDGHEQTAAPGTLVHFPAGTRHCFRFGKGGGELFSITSCEAASHLFTDLDRELAPDDPDFAKMIEVSARHGLEILVSAD